MNIVNVRLIGKHIMNNYRSSIIDRSWIKKKPIRVKKYKKSNYKSNKLKFSN